MQFKMWGEDQFIEYLKKQFPSKDSCLGIGDDCAVIPGSRGDAWLVTTDAVVEGVHFLKNQISAKNLGYKALAVSVSDILAMGGIPKYTFLSIAIPKDTDSGWVREFIQGLKEACDEWNIILLGGDTVGSKRDIFLNLTVIGTAVDTKIKYRHGAKEDDLICVTGYLGDSGGGLKAILEGLQRTEDIEYLIRAHVHPALHLKSGNWLASNDGVHAMMDISDGLECDLKRLIKSSQKGAIIDTSQIPISNELKRVSLENKWDPLQISLTGGEDYCLLFTVTPENFETLQEGFEKTFGEKLSVIGKITDKTERLVYLDKGREIQLNYASFDHF